MKAVSVGGFPNAERRVMLMGAAEVVDALVGSCNPAWEEDYVSALSIQGNFKFDKKKRNHRHVLGSILGLGIDRSTVGDIIVPEDMSSPLQAVVKADMSDYVCTSLSRISRIPVAVERVPLAELALHQALSKAAVVVKTTSSCRLDAVTSISFKLSRSKTVMAIKNGEVQLNWQLVKPGAEVQAGDVITFRGKGRARIESIEENHRERMIVAFSLYT